MTTCNSLKNNFRYELLRSDVAPKELNDVSLKFKHLLLIDIQNKKIELENVANCQCGSDSLDELAKIDRFGLPFGSFICKECGLVITSPRIKSESLPYYYDRYYHPLNYGQENLQEQEALFEVGQGKKIFNLLREFLPNKTNLKVLEIGAGTGNVLDELRCEALKNNIKINALGTEYSSECILKANERGVNVIYGDLGTIVDLKEKYDVVILSHVFEHLIDLEYELNLLKKIIDKDSLLYIEVPGILSLHKKNYYNNNFLGYLIHAHMYNFTMHSLSNILCTFGFKPIYLNSSVESIFKIGEFDRFSNEYFRVLNYLELINEPSFLEEKNKLQRWHQAEKEENIKLRRWHQAEKEENIKLRRWHQAEKEENIKLRRWHQAEKDKVNRVISAYENFTKIDLLRNPIEKKNRILVLLESIKNLKVNK